MSEPRRKFGLFTAIAMVVGIVIGSGVFKSAGDVLAKAGGSLSTALLAWGIGGLIIIISTYAFSIVALKKSKKSGIIDFMEEMAGKKTAYLVGWFLNFVYYPILVGILAWLAGSITNTLLGFNTDLTWPMTVVFFIGTYILNIFAPVIAGRWQISSTAIKIIPLILIALVGLIFGLVNGTTMESFTVRASNVQLVGTGLAAAVAVTAFAYDGWITALAITQELKDAKKNLSRALIGGSVLIVFLYMIFFIGLSGVISNNEAVALAGSMDTSVLAAERLFGAFFGPVVSVLILVSVLGTLNGLTMGAVRGMFQISVKGIGPSPQTFVKLGKKDQPLASGLLSFILSIFWLMIWFGNFQGYWGGFMDTSVLTIVFLYGSFIIIYVDIMLHFKELNVFKRFVIPSLASIGALYLVFGAFTSDPRMFLFFSIIVTIFLVIGFLTFEKKPVQETTLINAKQEL
jgi:APA family basic amino acid/polyamine antiporter